ncbi:amidohydrolase family protein [Agromyces mangrovi Wang et al. 2018]|uniref:amidohydrolase family protein n=1 Tax=Agromyces mangrovi TaxID=1858653 RepID=UPI0025748ED9|nr:amidohydrolase family protein [Agromyces mangrovi]BDZ65471.1 isoaspartyl dipeptidase [Agromyces mangrovi]
MQFHVLRGGSVLSPTGFVPADVWTAAGTILGVGPHASGPEAVPPGAPDAIELDCTGKLVTPGLVDGHLHIMGGGGGGGYASRIPELPVDAVLEAGITTCVAMPGVDPLTRPLEGLLALARAYRQQGVRAVAMTGGFIWPPRTLTGGIRSDVYLIPDLVGVKVALGEHLATAPDAAELVSLLRELEWVGRMTGGAALLHAHLGMGDDPARDLEVALVESGVDRPIVQVTHANYTEQTLAAAIRLGGAGCRVDVNPLLRPGRVAGALSPVEAVRRLLDAEVPLERLSLSTDGNASVPREIADGSYELYDRHLDLLGTVRALESEGILSLEEAFGLVTANPAEALQRGDLGLVRPGAAADLLVLDPETLAVETVLSDGVVRVRDGRAVAPSKFRDPRWQA